MEPGLYETVLTTDLQRRLDAVLGLTTDIAKVDPADQALVLSRHLGAALSKRLAAESSPEGRLAVANAILASIEANEPSVLEPVRQLHGVHAERGPGARCDMSNGRRRL